MKNTFCVYHDEFKLNNNLEIEFGNAGILNIP